MLPESVLNTLAGGFIGIFGGLAIWFISDRVEIRRRRIHLVDAVESAITACMVPLISSSITGGGEYFNPVTQFLPAFWQDLGLLGTGTQAKTINFFSMIAEAHEAKVPLHGHLSRVPLSKQRLALLEREKQQLMKLLDLERRGQRQKLQAAETADLIARREEKAYLGTVARSHRPSWLRWKRSRRR